MQLGCVEVQTCDKDGLDGWMEACQDREHAPLCDELEAMEAKIADPVDQKHPSGSSGSTQLLGYPDGGSSDVKIATRLSTHA